MSILPDQNLRLDSILAVFMLVCSLSASASEHALENFGVDARNRILQDSRAQQLSRPFGAHVGEAESARGTATSVTVGSGADCDESDLNQAIINAPDGAELLLESGSFAGNFQIYFGKNLTIVGGFGSCSDSSPSGTSTLDAGGSGTVLDIWASSGTWKVELRNLNLTGGSNSASLAGGLHIEGDQWVVLDNVEITNNVAAGDGGGVQVTGDSGATLWMTDTVVANNSADQGGGIACVAPTDQLAVIIDQASIFENDADFGGGIYSDNCLVAMHAGGFLEGVFLNEATTSGGGIAAVGQSEVGVIGTSPGYLVAGDPYNSANVESNSAGSMGGGILAVGNSVVTAIDGTITGNNAKYGGGAMAHTGGRLVMKRGDGTDCQRYDSDLSPAPCSRLENNHASEYGGALAMTNSGTSASINQSFISGNDTGGQGSVAYSLEGVLEMEGNVIHANSGPHLFHMQQAARLDLRWSTVTDNQPDVGSPALVYVSGSSVGTTTVELYSSIFWNSGRDLVQTNEATAPVSVSADCLISHELSSIPGATASQIADPQFANAANDDFHIQEGSPAVDFCTGAHAPAEDDMDESARGTQIHGDATRTYDAGADEFWPGVVFSDRFEQN